MRAGQGRHRGGTGQLHKTNALLIALQFALNHECEFDVSDALAVVIELVEQTPATWDLLTLEAAP